MASSESSPSSARKGERESDARSSSESSGPLRASTEDEDVNHPFAEDKIFAATQLPGVASPPAAGLDGASGNGSRRPAPAPRVSGDRAARGGGTPVRAGSRLSSMLTSFRQLGKSPASEERSQAERCPDVLLLTVSGIGSSKEKADADVTKLNACIAEVIGAKFSSVDFHVCVESVDWHDALQCPPLPVVERVHQVIPSSFERMRRLITSYGLDLYFYFSTTRYRQIIIDTVASSLNAKYAAVKEQFPNFDGQVSIFAHSLGSVVCFDLLAYQDAPREFDGDSPFANENERHDVYPKLDFEVENLFMVGSPMGVGLSIRQSEGQETRIPKCSVFNVFHPHDLIAFRIEPPLDQRLSPISPVSISNWKTMDKSAWIRVKGSIDTARESFRSYKLSMKQNMTALKENMQRRLTLRKKRPEDIDNQDVDEMDESMSSGPLHRAMSAPAAVNGRSEEDAEGNVDELATVDEEEIYMRETVERSVGIYSTSHPVTDTDGTVIEHRTETILRNETVMVNIRGRFGYENAQLDHAASEPSCSRSRAEEPGSSEPDRSTSDQESVRSSTSVLRGSRDDIPHEEVVVNSSSDCATDRDGSGARSPRSSTDDDPLLQIPHLSEHDASIPAFHTDTHHPEMSRRVAFKRYDYQLQEKITDDLKSILSAFQNHTIYWRSKDLVNFVLTHMLTCHLLASVDPVPELRRSVSSIIESSDDEFGFQESSTVDGEYGLIERIRRAVSARMQK